MHNIDEVTKILKNMANDLTKVKQFQTTNPFIDGPPSRMQNPQTHNKPKYKRIPLIDLHQEMSGKTLTPSSIPGDHLMLLL